MNQTPVTVVTGFLGSGKTTLISSVLNQTPDRRLAVLVNEFGAKNVDGQILRSERLEHCEIFDLEGGLIAYSDADAFLPTLRELQRRRHRFDHVLIETSGLAVPTAVYVVLESPEFSADFVLDATLAVVDTPLLLGGDFELGEGSAQASQAAVQSLFDAQLEQADVVVLNKIDDLSEYDLLRAEGDVRNRAPRVRFLELAYGAALDPQLTLGLKLHELSAGHHHGPVRSSPGDDGLPLSDQTALDGHSHGDLGAHLHSMQTHLHFHVHDTGWQSFTLKSSAPQDAARLPVILEDLARKFPVLRAKGFAQVGGDQVQTLQAVRTRVEAETRPGLLDASELVFIGYHINRKKVIQVLSGATGTLWE
ncbi:CobW family GTP-binding protein [Deinococcus arenicola]|uniref:GTP-binding protein n=1 Tax=Deinococcus arenicola TaxID=2994950 RepID=A0ABU4DTI0_9DEIO|nr:GTP-binding protein [Deinococcus sp. ZS9-10]MDV6375735.1 GTP-binding protein [Deinococcus sp. ZS9-10]